jgi:asparagine synthase (glutamine-hydrolysing)
MSAICGLYYRNGQPVPPENASRMMEAFRGALFDVSGIWREDNLFLGSRLQWVTPEVAAEKLPFYDSLSGLVITADALIDNQEELFDRLAILHSRRKDFTNSMLILEAYRKWEEDCPRFLKGQFAFVIWDKRRQKLFGARDQVGKSTFYYYASPDLFAFATLIKPLLSVNEIPPKYNEAWLADFLAIPSLAHELEPQTTLYEKILQLMPGHQLTLTAHNLKIQEYWRVREMPELHLKDDGEYEAAFREVLTTAVRCRTRSAGEVGVMLSGGLDSASVACLAARELLPQGKSLKAFTSIPMRGYRDWTPANKLADERAYVESIRRQAGNIETVYCRAEGRNVLNTTDKLFDILEQPYKIITNIHWLDSIAETAAQNYGVKVLLSGQSGNATISWGEPQLYYAHLLHRLQLGTLWRELLAYHRRTGIGLLALLKRAILSNWPQSLPNLGKRISEKQTIYPAASIVNPNLAQKVNFLKRAQYWDANLENRAFHDTLTPRLRMLGVHMLSHTGAMEKKLSLWYKLVRRDPTRDIRVIEFCMQIPEKQYVRDGQGRFLLRRAMKGIIPDLVRLNTTVRGTQGADWLQRIMPYWRQVDAELQALLALPEVACYLDVAKLKTILKAVKDCPEGAAVPDMNYIMLVRALIFGRFMSRGRFV